MATGGQHRKTDCRTAIGNATFTAQSSPLRSVCVLVPMQLLVPMSMLTPMPMAMPIILLPPRYDLHYQHHSSTTTVATATTATSGWETYYVACFCCNSVSYRKEMSKQMYRVCVPSFDASVSNTLLSKNYTFTLSSFM